VLARQAADLIERTSVEQALRESEERFRLARLHPAKLELLVWRGRRLRSATRCPIGTV
jgi:hypothetical protein